MVGTILILALIGAVIYFGFIWEDDDLKKMKALHKADSERWAKEQRNQIDRTASTSLNVQKEIEFPKQPSKSSKRETTSITGNPNKVRRANDYSDDLISIIPDVVGDFDYSPSSSKSNDSHSVAMGGGSFGGGGASGGWASHSTPSHDYASNDHSSSYSDHSSSFDSGSCDSGGGDCGGGCD